MKFEEIAMLVFIGLITVGIPVLLYIISKEEKN